MWPEESSVKPEHTQMEVLTEQECLRLLTEHLPRVGRVGFSRYDWPVILPVNYHVTHGQVVFRTEIGSVLDELTFGSERPGIAFEVDAVDPGWREGWSVLMQGTASEIRDGHELERLRSLPLQPWAPGDRPRFVRIEPSQITGRRIR